MNSHSTPFGITVALIGDLYPERDLLCQDPSLQCMIMHDALDGSQALRLAGERAVDLWLIAASLSEMSGMDCVEMLKELSPQSYFCIVSPAYCPNEERMAFRFRRTLYVARPLDSWWLHELLRLCSSGRLRCKNQRDLRQLGNEFLMHPKQPP